MKVFAAHNPDNHIRSQSSSGGVFTILAENIIRHGGVVYGAAFDENWRVVHRRIDSIDNLKTLRGSKYVFSHVATAYNQALTDLSSGRQVLFSGTPCQIAAMRKRAPSAPHLLLVEVVCHGAPQPIYWIRYLSELTHNHHRSISDIVGINFRDKRTGWKNYSFTIQYNDGKTFTQLHDDNLYMRAFLKDLTLREACFRCPFKYPHGTQADITLGDLWGITQLAPEIDNDLGTTLVIIRTPAGHAATTSLPGLKQLSLDDAAKYNPAIISSVTRPECYDSFILASKTGAIIRLFRKFCSRPVLQLIYIRLARFKHALLHL